MRWPAWLAAACLLGAVAVVLWPGRARAVRRRLASIATARSTTAAGPPWSGQLVRSGVRRLRSGWRAWPARVVLPVGAGLSGLAATVVAGPVAGVAAAGYSAVILGAALRRRADRAAAATRVRTLDAVSALAADLRAGATPATATGPGRPAAVTGAAGAAGSRLDALVAALVRLADQTGAPLADLLERVVADARAIDRVRATAAASAAGARATAWLLAALPAGGLGLGYAIGADPGRVLLHTPLGAGCLLGAVALQLAGLAWADRLTRPTRIPPEAQC